MRYLLPLSMMVALTLLAGCSRSQSDAAQAPRAAQARNAATRPAQRAAPPPAADAAPHDTAATPGSRHAGGRYAEIAPVTPPDEPADDHSDAAASEDMPSIATSDQ